jgi:serine protease Do
MRKVAVIALVLTVIGVAFVFEGRAYGQTPPRPDDRMWSFPFITAGPGSRIGVSVRELEADEAGKLKLPAEAGAVVQSVRPSSPAESAGLRENDVIVEFDGERVRSAQQLSRLVGETPPGRRVNMAFIRDGRRTQVQVTPEASRAGLRFDPDEFRGRFDRVLPGGRGSLGVGTQEMTPELAQHFGARNGILVTSVNRDSPADKGGIKVGDVITEFDGVSVDATRDLIRAVVRRQGEVTLKVVRDKKELTLKVMLEDRAERRSRQRASRGI